ncbi:MAG: PhnD/SsuA/transferrin family substrate-binding protein [Ignavibacteria bacterium]|nr:PhnD/SsuA/transferrin family substrate-binding protein [Ignavibacteria bacterium]
MQRERLDARAKVATEHPDVFDVVKVIALTEEIPNDPVVIRKGLPQDVADRLIAALLQFQETPQGKASLMTIASVEGFTRTNDAEYQDVRTLVAKYGVDVESTLRKKKR